MIKNLKERINAFRKWWKVAPPKTKRTFVVSGLLIGLAIFLIISSLFSSFEKKKKQKPKPLEIEILSRKTQEKITESASVRRLRGKFNALKADVDNIKKELNELKENMSTLSKTLEGYQIQMKTFQDKLIEKTGELQELYKKIEKEKRKKKEFAKKKSKTEEEEKRPTFEEIWGKPPVYPVSGKTSKQKKAYGKGKSMWQKAKTKPSNVPPGISPVQQGLIKEKEIEEEKEAGAGIEKLKEEKEITIRLPAGSFFRGILLNGVDAPVTMVAKKTPYPVLIKVKTEAWLPNEYRYDITGCYIVAAAWGDMSSERAYFRTERLSCIRKDGGVIETPLDASIVDGQDGKLGVFGRLVSKQGQIIGRTILAEMISGFGNALTPRQSIPVFNIGESENNEEDYYFTPPLKKALSYGFFSGVGESMKKVADFYLKMAEQTFPVIEIQAGTPVEVFLLRGLTFTIKQQNTSGFVKSREVGNG